jgi:dCTP deaminase
MSILSDRWIREQAQSNGIIEPFVEAQRREGCISYGLSSYGYDARVADEFKIFTNVDSATVDPKDFASNSFVDRKTDVCIIPPTASPWRARSNTSACRATCWSSASASRPMPAEGSS